MSVFFRKNERFYHLHEQQNFFGGISLICSWGTFDSHRGGHKIFICNDQDELKNKMNEMRKIRKYRGYEEY